jgi:endonuclease YncB( thermonuclease family)
MKRRKYFRIVADVFVDGQDLGQELTQKGLAKPYEGGKKRSGCDSMTVSSLRKPNIWSDGL